MNGPFSPRHPLDGAVSAGGSRHVNHVAILPQPLVLSIRTLPKQDHAVAMAIDLWREKSLRRAGPGEWWLVQERMDLSVLADLVTALKGQALVTDQSSARAVLRLSGPDCRAILAKCVAIDLHPDVFLPGQSASLMVCHVAGHLARLGADLFEISLPRSFALFAFEGLMEMGLEYGLTAGFAT